MKPNPCCPGFYRRSHCRHQRRRGMRIPAFAAILLSVFGPQSEIHARNAMPDCDKAFIMLDSEYIAVRRTITCDTVPALDARITNFTFSTTSPEGEMQKVAGWLLWKYVDGEVSPLYVFNHNSEEPRKPLFTDLNTDGRPDILFRFGRESFKASYVFLNAMKPGQVKGDPFALKLTSEGGFVTVADCDKDGKPEIIDIRAAVKKDAPAQAVDPAADSSALYDLPDSVATAVTDVCRAIAGPFDSLNIANGAPGERERRNLHLLDNIVIWKFTAMTRTDFTGKCVDHLKWRISVLKAFVPRNDATRARIAKTAAYLKGRLAK